jgi:spore germination protein YaaH
MQANFLAITAFMILSFFSYVNGPSLPAHVKESITSGKDQEVSQIRVTGDRVNAYLEADALSNVLTDLAKDTRLDILKSTEDWYQVSTPSGPAWVRKWLVTPAPTDTKPKEKYVVAYYAENYQGDSLAYDSMSKNYRALTALSPFLYQVGSHGKLIRQESSFQIQDFAKTKGFPFIPIIHNHNPKVGFDKEVMHTILSAPEMRTSLIKDICAIVAERGYEGINIDFENLYPSDRPYLTLFMKELWEELKPQGVLITMSVPAKSGDFPASEWIGAHDYKALAQYLDYMMIMTYDQHNTSSMPGPVASIAWVKEVIEYALKHVPKDKILMGVAGYGYDWDLTLNSARTRTFSNTMALANSLAKEKGVQLTDVLSWDPLAMSHYIDYKDSNGKSHQVWFEDSRSLSHKLDLVNQYDLGGIAIWRLGLEDPQIWNQIMEKLR